MNRKITEEFEGDLTDVKVNQIIEKYGLPTKFEENMPGWRDGNFLNDFVIRYFTNGAWENGVLPTERYSLGETELGKAKEIVYIGDSEVDIMTGKKGGFPSISVAWGFRTGEFLKNHGAERIAFSPDELIEMILSL